MRIHVLGIGKMGLPMARHLQAAGHELSVADPSPERTALAASLGLKALPLAEALPLDLVVSSLPHDQALEDVAAQLARTLPRGVCFIDTSTVSPAASARAAAVLSPAGIDYLRVTVSGNNAMAEAAQLTAMASGPRDVFDRLRPVLQAWGPTQFYLGEAEQARLMKLVVNLMILQTSAMLGEALVLGEEGGLDWADMWDVLTASAVASPIVKAKAGALRQKDFTPTFTVRQMIKDASLILDEGHRLGQPMDMTTRALAQLREAEALGHGDLDYAALMAALKPGLIARA